ncbi:HNH endonuclease signature motif containing protein [Stenotrophomonas sp. SMYL20]|uniref:HNH endonuclease n=1 Tax=Stenotrophomonas sp. SMYL20 TaxID=3076043 RepID=UPI002E799802|nr:HNH endonuclease signature motif containing protein [Stenotrophomonas sp. SMYL20]
MPRRAPKHNAMPRQAAVHVPPAAVRQTTAERGYGGRWQRARATYLLRHPLCAECQRLGHVTVATVVDHITPHKGSQALFWDTDNWQPLCKPCHDRKTATEDGGFGNWHRGAKATPKCARGRE